MKTFKYVTNSGFPKLAWCLMIQEKEDEITVFHGSFVETRKDFFVEGVWDSSFEEGAFDESELLMGSGARIRGDSVVVASPCHTLEKTYTLRRNAVFLASNSLSFLLSAASTELDVDHIEYHTDLASILLGVKDCVKRIPTADGSWIELHYCRNVRVDSQLRVESMPKPVPAPFATYSDYHQYCLNGLRRLFQNGVAGRDTTYSPLASLSSGYDSACTAALAKASGCDRAVTIRSLSKTGISDSGKKIAEVLGYSEIREYEYRDYAKIGFLSEAEVFASGDLALIRFNTFESQCARSLLITGINGDVIWDKNNSRVGDYRRKESNLGGLSSGIAEFRLGVGCIHIPVPFFGAAQHESMYRISNSEEMAPWVVGGDYDRPLPRRILEEMGVPRGLFGVGKRGIGIGVSYFPKRMHPDSYRALQKFYRENRSKRSKLKRIRFWTLYLVNLATKAPVIVFNKCGIGRMYFPRIVPFKYMRSPGLASYMIPWGVSVLKKSRYSIVR